MTAYYNICTNDVSKWWNTKKIIYFINCSNKFTYIEKGYFKCKNEYCCISLIYTNDFNSFASCINFNDDKTNYISIVTSLELSNEMMNLLKNLAQYLNAQLVEEE